MLKTIKIFLILILLFSSIVFSQSRQSATVNIRIKLVKSISVSVENKKISGSSASEKIIDKSSSLIKSDAKRNILINYRIKPLHDSSLKNSFNNNKFDYLSNPILKYNTDENSINYFGNIKDSQKYQNILASKQLIFNYQQIKNVNNDDKNLFITVVY